MWLAASIGVTTLTVSGLTVDDWDANTITYNTQPTAYTDADISAFAPVEFSVYGDGALLATATAAYGETPALLSVPLDDVDELRLVTNANDSPLAAHAVWADAKVYDFVPTDTTPPATEPPATEPPTTEQPSTPGTSWAQVDAGEGRVEAGGSLSVTVNGLEPGQQIGAVVHSDPLTVTGIPAADAQGAVTFSVRIPADFALGAHTLEITADGEDPIVLDITVVAAGSLAVTGMQLPVVLLVVTFGLLAAGALLTVMRRRTAVS